MVDINYSLGNRRNPLRLSASEARFLLLNNKNCFYAFSENECSRYDGFCIPFGKQFLKVIDRIEQKNCGKVRSVTHKGYKAEVERGDFIEEYYIPKNHMSLVYSTNRNSHISILFDVKMLFDNDEWGRNYRIVSNGPTTLIEFKKTKGEHIEFSKYIAVSAKLVPHENWSKTNYALDASRNSPPFSRFIFSPGIFQGDRLVVTVADSPAEALRENNQIFNNLIRLETKERDAFVSGLKQIEAPEDVNVAYNLCRHYLSKLATPEGILAGLPWFSEVWSRDELISLGGLMEQENEDYVKSRLNYYLGLVYRNGRLAARIGAPENGDSAGWLFRRVLDFYLKTKATSSKSKFTEKEIEQLLDKSLTSLDSLTKDHMKNGLVEVEPGETWMDSLDRAGARIEIQALTLPLLELLRLLTKDTAYVNMERLLCKSFKSHFFVNEQLYDAPNDGAQRPNIFIAAYVSQRLLTQMEWRKAIIKSVQALWNDWGGFSTIDKKSELYQPIHSGENPISYHNGDSWFYLNNMAALVLKKMDLPGFSSKINKILEASTQEILTQGALGCHGELSSSQKLDSQGAWLQAWSCSTYIELIEALFKDF